jgi:hypothetical protein
MTRNLGDVVPLAAAVDRALADCIDDGAEHYGALAYTPERAVLRLADCCEGIYVLETADGKGHRSWV